MWHIVYSENKSVVKKLATSKYKNTRKRKMQR